MHRNKQSVANVLRVKQPVETVELSFEQVLALLRPQLLFKLIPSLGPQQAIVYLDEMKENPSDEFKEQLKQCASTSKVNVCLGQHIVHHQVKLVCKDL